MATLEQLAQELELIKLRNKKVEKDKEWEVSWTRRISIAVLTYFTILLFFLAGEFDRPFVSALVPTLGFLLSTLSLGILKKIYFNRNK